MVIDLGEQPTPEIEPAEPPPGGVDAVEDAEYDPQRNPINRALFEAFGAALKEHKRAN